MNLAKPQIDAVRAFGYTEQESRFVCLVATHSGYFIARQFLGFAGVCWGKRTTRFWQKLKASRHAHIYRFAQGGTVYHLFSQALYRQIGLENLRNHREHEFDYIRTRIAILDFVLGNLQNRYLETEQEKVAYFCSEQNVPGHDLPSKTYAARHTAKPSARYFTDRFPVFLPPEPAPRIITFTYIQGPELNLAGFAHHLKAYLPLFRQLSEFRFLFLARTEAYFLKAAERFRDLVTIPLESRPADDLLRYFEARRAWDQGEYDSVTEDDLIFRNRAREHFGGARFEHLYRVWKAGRVSESEIRRELEGSDKPHDVRFEAQVLAPIAGPKSGAPNEVLSRGRPAGVSRNRFEEEAMPIVKKAPAILTRELHLEEPVSVLLDDYACFIDSTADHVVNSVLKKTLWRDQDYRKWRDERRSLAGEKNAGSTGSAGE
jgi:hypothetical protein